MFKRPGKQETVHGEVVPDSEHAREVLATRMSEAEVKAVTRHHDINLIWEKTQAYMAVLVITVVLVAAVYIAISDPGPARSTALVFLSGLANLVAGFYFGRTNHTRPTGEDRRG